MWNYGGMTMDYQELKSKLQLYDDILFLYFQFNEETSYDDITDTIIESRKEFETKIIEIEERIKHLKYSINDKVDSAEFEKILKENANELAGYETLSMFSGQQGENLIRIYGNILANKSMFGSLILLAHRSQLHLDSFIRIMSKSQKFDSIKTLSHNLGLINVVASAGKNHKGEEIAIPINFVEIIINAFQSKDPYELYELYSHILYIGNCDSNLFNNCIVYYIDNNNNFNINDFFLATLNSQNDIIAKYVQTLKRFNINETGEVGFSIENCLTGNHYISQFGVLENPSLKLEIDYLMPSMLMIGEFDVALSMLENDNFVINDLERFVDNVIKSLKGKEYPMYMYYASHRCVRNQRKYTKKEQSNILSLFIANLIKKYQNTSDSEKVLEISKKITK